jgi:hypothetical protein
MKAKLFAFAAVVVVASLYVSAMPRLTAGPNETTVLVDDAGQTDTVERTSGYKWGDIGDGNNFGGPGWEDLVLAAAAIAGLIAWGVYCQFKPKARQCS